MAIVPDPVFMAASNATAAVYRNVNASGAVRTGHKGVPEDWQPVSGLGAVPVILGRGTADVLDLDGREQPVMRWKVMAQVALALDQTYKLVVPDPLRGGALRQLYVSGKSSLDFTGTHHVSVELIEYVKAAP